LAWSIECYNKTKTKPEEFALTLKTKKPYNSINRYRTHYVELRVNGD